MTGPLELIAAAGPEWSGCWERLVAAVKGTGGGIVAEDPGPPEAGTPLSAVERYARAVSDAANPRVSLGLTLPVALVAGSLCGQGAFWARGRLDDGSWLKIPGILQATVVAPSGYGKSTVLNPLVALVEGLDLRAGRGRRAGLVQGWKTTALQQLGLVVMDQNGTTWTPQPGAEDACAEIAEIFKSGLAAKDLAVDSSTPEGLRDHLVDGGGVAAILTAEPDILREVSSYARDSGTFRWFVDGWGADKVGVARAGGRNKVVPRVSLPYGIVLQPSSFDQFIAGQNQAQGNDQVGGIVASGAIGRGVYGRSWLVRLDGWSSGELRGFGMEAPVDTPGGAAATDSVVLSAKDQAELDLEEVFGRLLERSDPYRARMGICIGWGMASGEGRCGGMPYPGLPEPLWLPLADQAAWLVWAAVQNIRLALIDLVSQLEIVEPGSDPLFAPMTSRWTQQVLRLALVLQLTADPDAEKLQGWALRDAALRVGPWLFEHWCAEIRRYRKAAVEQLLEQEIRNNPRGEDQTFQGQIAAAIRALQQEAGDPVVVFAQGTVVREAWRRARGRARGMLSAPFNEAFEELVQLGALTKVEAKPTGKAGKPAVRWTRAAAAARYGF